VRGNLQALFGKRPTEKDPAKGTSPAVHFTLWEPGGEIPPGHPTHTTQHTSKSQWAPPRAIASGLNSCCDFARKSLNALTSWSRSSNSSK
jgi:hypothetical protein